MEYRELGKTGIKVSVIGIGGEGFENSDFDSVEKLVDCAIHNGMNYFDIYNSNPNVRSFVGKALSKYPRSSFVIEGHLGTTWVNDQYKRTRDIDEVKASFNDLLTRMQLDYIDVGMIHYVDEFDDFDRVFNGELIEYAKQLKQEGIIKHIGLSTHNTDIALKAVETGLVEVILFSINPAYDMLPASDDIDIFFEADTFKDVTYEGIDPKRDKLYRTCENKGIALTVMKGYAAGVLLDEKQSPFKKALSPVQCLHYCLTRPSVACVTIGVETIEQIEAACQYMSASDQEKDYSLVLADAPKTAFNGQCMYCGHCAPCTKKIDIASVNKYLDLSLVQKQVPDTLKDHYQLLDYHARDCIECGICETNCPFGVKIIEKMRQAVQLFGY